MSGVYINGFKLPRKTYECPFCDYEQGQCLVDYGLTDDPYYDKARRCSGDNENCDRPTWCPLIAVPDHGRLVDADALKKTEVQICYVNTLLGRNRRIVFSSEIDKAATVIPAERSEDGET